MKLMKNSKFRKRREYIEELAKNIPFGHFCWGCKYKSSAGSRMSGNDVEDGFLYFFLINGMSKILEKATRNIFFIMGGNG